MSLYTEAQQADKALRALINDCISDNPTIKSTVKAKKAKVTVSPANVPADKVGLVGVSIIGDLNVTVNNGTVQSVTPKTIYLPFNSKMQASDLEEGKIVSVWYNYSLNNGIVMQNADWTKGENIIVDTALSETSANPVRNSVITVALNDKANTNGTYPDMTAGNSNNLGGLPASGYELNRYAIVGQTTNTIEKPWYKVAEVTLNSSYLDRRISFYAFSTYADNLTEMGVLTAHIRTEGKDGGVWQTSELVWEYAASEITTSNFVLTHTTTAPCVAQIWVKIPVPFRSFVFKEICESNTEGLSNDDWTLYNTRGTGVAEIPIVSGTKQNSTLATLKNKIIVDNTHPIGSYYISNTNTSPALLFGGSWTSVVAGAVLRTKVESESTTANTLITGTVPNIKGNVSIRQTGYVDTAYDILQGPAKAFTVTTNAETWDSIQVSGEYSYNSQMLNFNASNGAVKSNIYTDTTTYGVVPDHIAVYMWFRTA